MHSLLIAVLFIGLSLGFLLAAHYQALSGKRLWLAAIFVMMGFFALIVADRAAEREAHAHELRKLYHLHSGVSTTLFYYLPHEHIQEYDYSATPAVQYIDETAFRITISHYVTVVKSVHNPNAFYFPPGYTVVNTLYTYNYYPSLYTQFVPYGVSYVPVSLTVHTLVLREPDALIHYGIEGLTRQGNSRYECNVLHPFNPNITVCRSEGVCNACDGCQSGDVPVNPYCNSLSVGLSLIQTIGDPSTMTMTMTMAMTVNLATTGYLVTFDMCQQNAVNYAIEAGIPITPQFLDWAYNTCRPDDVVRYDPASGDFFPEDDPLRGAPCLVRGQFLFQGIDIDNLPIITFAVATLTLPSVSAAVQTVVHPPNFPFSTIPVTVTLTVFSTLGMVTAVHGPFTLSLDTRIEPCPPPPDHYTVTTIRSRVISFPGKCKGYVCAPYSQRFFEPFCPADFFTVVAPVNTVDVYVYPAPAGTVTVHGLYTSYHTFKGLTLAGYTLTSGETIVYPSLYSPRHIIYTAGVNDLKTVVFELPDYGTVWSKVVRLSPVGFDVWSVTSCRRGPDLPPIYGITAGIHENVTPLAGVRPRGCPANDGYLLAHACGAVIPIEYNFRKRLRIWLSVRSPP